MPEGKEQAKCTVDVLAGDAWGHTVAVQAERGHALIRVWADKAWWLACCNPGCTYRIFESLPTHPKEAPRDASHSR